MRDRLIGLAVASAFAITFAAGGAQAASTAVIGCDNAAGSTISGSAEHRQVVLGSVSAPPARVQIAQPESSVSPWRYFAKSGFEIHTGSERVVVGVPAAWAKRVAVTWGGPAGAFGKVLFQACRRPGGLTGQWNGYPGGFYLNERTECVPITVTIGRRSKTVRVGIGTSCASR